MEDDIHLLGMRVIDAALRFEDAHRGWSPLSNGFARDTAIAEAREKLGEALYAYRMGFHSEHSSARACRSEEQPQ